MPPFSFWPFLAGALALVYLLTMSRSPYQGQWLVKAAPILTLAAWALDGGDGWLVAALLFSAAGDVALALDRQRYFIFGLGFFFLGHVFYVVRFAAGWQPEPLWWLLLIAVLAAAGALIRIMWSGMGRLRVPVLAYIGVITLMVLTAGGQSAILAVGALLFMASDALIGLDKFWRSIDGVHTWIMIFYYAGQLTMATALLM